MTWLVFGDSHIATIRHAYSRGWMPRACEFNGVGGATAIGLRNSNSQTNALEAFADWLLPVREGAEPVMQLGEVDCGFVIWWRAERLKESVEAQLAASVDAHLAFVDRLLGAGYRRVVLTGATLPTIQDSQDWGEIANKRLEVTVSLRRRTELTLAYNGLLKKAAGSRRCPFIDISPELLNPQTGVIKDYYRADDPQDHHLHSDRAGRLWADAFTRLEDRSA